MAEFSMVFLEHEDWPEWFTLDFLPRSPSAGEPSIIIGIANYPLRWLADNLAKYSVREYCEKHLREYGIEPDFLYDIDRPWGFGGVLKPHARRKSISPQQLFTEYSIAIPQVEKKTGKKCEQCGGTGEDSDFDRKCFYCSGDGEETKMDWDELDRVAATICVLGAILDKPGKEMLVGIESKNRQLLSVDTHFERGRAFIGAVLAKPLGDYLRSISGQELPGVKSAIKNTYLRMFPSHKRFDDFHFRAFVRDRSQLIIDVPGDACGLYVDGHSRSLREDSGPMKLSCHNVDGHHQQMALFAGLAALFGVARKKLY